MLSKKVKPRNQIQLGQAESLQSSRPVKQKLIPIKNQTQIFDEDFGVQNMDNPKHYLEQYGLSRFQDVNNVASCEDCCGQIGLSIGSIFSLCCMKCCVYELETSHAGLVQSFGRFRRLLKPGFNRLNACSEEVRLVDMRVKMIQTGFSVGITKDTVQIRSQLCIFYRIINPILVYYGLGDQTHKAVKQAGISAFRAITAKYTFQQILTNRKSLFTEVMEETQLNVARGIKIENIFIQQILIPKEIQSSLSMTAKQKRISQANIINAKADVQCAELMKQQIQLLDIKAAFQIRYLEMVQELGKRGAKIIMDIGVDQKGFTSSYTSKMQ